MKALLIGRHVADVGDGIEVLERRAVVFPATARECEGVIANLINDAKQADAALLFQAMPGQAAVALARLNARQCIQVKVGVIISVPGPRPTIVREVYTIGRGVYMTLERAVKLANPRAKVGFASYDEPDVDDNVGYSPDVQAVYVEVDGPPMPFQFSHIEWLN